MNRLHAITLFSLVIWTSIISTNASVHLGSRVVAGEEADEGAYPYQVSLRSNHRHFCGGSIVTTLHIVTAAHCVLPLPVLSQITVITGSNSIARGGETHGISGITPHPEYIGDANYWQNDIAIITLAAALTVTPLQSPIPVATVDPPFGIEAIVTGWGRIFPESNALPARLQALRVPTMNTTVCRQLWGLDEIEDVHLCAWRNWGFGTCNGDSGGPVVYNGQLIGAVSWGPVPCASGFPDVYVRVSKTIDFIQSITGLSLS